MADRRAKDRILGLLSAAALSEARNPDGTNHILLHPGATELNPMNVTDRLDLLNAALDRESEDDTPDDKKASLLTRELFSLPVHYEEGSLRTEFLDKDWTFVKEAIEMRRVNAVRAMDGNSDVMGWAKYCMTPHKKAALVELANALAAGVILEEISWRETREDLSASIREVTSIGAFDGMQVEDQTGTAMDTSFQGEADATPEAQRDHGAARPKADSDHLLGSGAKGHEADLRAVRARLMTMRSTKKTS